MTSYMLGHLSSQHVCTMYMYMSLAIYVCLPGLWLGRLLHLSFLSTFLKLVCYAHVFPCTLIVYM